jgi:hypothetical protein
MTLKNLLLRVGADITGLTSGMKNAQKSVKGFKTSVASNLGGVKGIIGGVVGGLATLGLGTIFKEGISDAMKFEALMGTLGQTMGQSTKDFMTWQDTVGASLGFSKVQGAELANTLSLNFKSISSSTEDLMQKTTKMMETAAIISNKRGMTMQDVSDRIRSAMNGEADAADELGVNVRIAAIKTSKAYQELGKGMDWDKLSENLRRTILYEHILEQTSMNLGTTIQDTTQLRMAQFNASLVDLRMALGQAFLPILNVALPALTSLIRGMEKALNTFSYFIATLLGFEMTQKKTEKQTKSMTKLGNSAVKTGKQIKKASEDIKRGIAGFDEVNLLAEDSKTKDPLDNINQVPTPPPVPLQPDAPKPWDNIYADISKGAKDYADKLKMDLNPQIANLKDSWSDLKLEIGLLMNSDQIVKLKDWVKGTWIPAAFGYAIETISKKFDAISGALKTVRGLLDGDWSTAWEGFKEFAKKAPAFDPMVFSNMGLQMGKLIGAAVKTKVNGTWTELQKEWKTDKFLIYFRQSAKAIADAISGAFTHFVSDPIKVFFNRFAIQMNDWIEGINNLIDKFKILSGGKIRHLPTIDLIEDPDPAPRPKGTRPNIPMAKGGIVDRPTHALIGEGGEKEAVSPLSDLQGMISTAVLSAMQFNQGNKATGDLILNIDGRQFARIVQPFLNREQARIGTNLNIKPI